MVLRGFKPRVIVAPTPFPHNGDPHHVARVYRAEVAQSLNFGSVTSPDVRVSPSSRAAANVRSALAERAFEAAHAEGRAMTF
jgi:hypothetical protein